MDSVTVPRKLWEHPDPKSTEMYRLMQEINAKHNLQLEVCSHALTPTVQTPINVTDLLGPLPILNHQKSSILGPSFPISRFDL